MPYDLLNKTRRIQNYEENHHRRKQETRHEQLLAIQSKSVS